jgi:hypothetical protein
MDLPKPFAFRTSAPGRKHGPAGYANYREYKDWLRDEFEFRCVYCMERETWYPSAQAAFAVEHVLAQVKRPDLICNYDNLAYSCLRCNSLKEDLETLDPSRDTLSDHLYFEADGSVVPRTNEGQEFILLFHLNAAPASSVRKEKLWILSLKTQYPTNPHVTMLYQKTFGYPEDLPDLTAKRPKSNTRPDGVRSCHFVRRREGNLPEVY